MCVCACVAIVCVCVCVWVEHMNGGGSFLNAGLLGQASLPPQESRIEMSLATAWL